MAGCICNLLTGENHCNGRCEARDRLNNHTTVARRLSGAGGVMSSRCPRLAQLARTINSNSQIVLHRAAFETCRLAASDSWRSP
jgi:hypothetical protein